MQPAGPATVAVRLTHGTGRDACSSAMAAGPLPQPRTKASSVQDELRSRYNRPATGRTTALGRKVEKPGIGKQAGPSGQKDKGPQDRKHANK